MQIILSSQYCNLELVPVIGLIPPCMIPFNNGRLFIDQIKFLKNFRKDQIYVTLPTTYDISKYDSNLLEFAQVRLIRFDVDKSLSEVICELISKENGTEPLDILYGDTLITSTKLKPGFVVTSTSDRYYNWGVGRDENILCGFFSFENAQLVRDGIEKYGDFIKFASSFRKTCKIPAEEWLDFGHLQNLFNSRLVSTISRDFNTLQVANNFLIKSSINKIKCELELEWFKSIPESYKLLTPMIFFENLSYGSYGIQIIKGFTLAEYLLFLKLKPSFWNKIFDELIELISKHRNLEKGSKLNFRNFLRQIFKKRRNQLKLFFQSTDCLSKNHSKYLPDNVFNNALSYCGDHLDTDVMHGDLCFSNILIEPFDYNIKVIDPRGSLDDINSTHAGYALYDLAKLAHSIIGGYDHIISGRYSVKHGPDNSVCLQIHFSRDDEVIQTEFIQQLSNHNLEIREIYAVVVILFLNMIPLHSDHRERQIAFYLNAIRIMEILNDNNYYVWDEQTF